MNESQKQDMKRVLLAGSVLGGLALIASILKREKPLKTVDKVDVKRYMGKWYEIAAFPMRFERNCTCTTAEYTLNDDGTVLVDNRCFNAKKKKWEGATATGFVQDTTTNAQLAVQFFWPFKGDYYIIALADDYSYAMVGAPSRKYLWILSRTPRMSEATYDRLTRIAAENGFDVRKLEMTKQKNCKSQN
jgi:apolipoprotein D and lipocalin family protein